MLKVKQVPNPYYVTQGRNLYDGNDGHLYFDEDIEQLQSVNPDWKRRKTKYGYTYYFNKTIEEHYRKEAVS